MPDYNIGAEFGRAAGDLIGHHSSLPPRLKNVHRAVMGTALLTFCAYTGWHVREFIHLRGAQALAGFLHPAHGLSSWSIELAHVSPGAGHRHLSR